MIRTYGIVAHPVEHSLSPQMQNAAFRHLSLNATFKRFDVSAERLPDFIARVRNEHIDGLAISLPHKESVLALLDGVTETARAIGAVNTVFWNGDRLWGDNTDAPGFWEAVADSLPATGVLRAAVIGAGGASRAVVCQLVNKQIAVTVFNRTRSKAQKIAHDFGCSSGEQKDFAAVGFDLVANCTSVGLREEQSLVDSAAWSGFTGVAFDAVFDPLYTVFLRDAKRAGATIITGERMLLFQGARQFTIWTSLQAPVNEMKSALDNAIADSC